MTKTAQYDAEAMRYLSYGDTVNGLLSMLINGAVLYPLVICFGVYTLVYREHKSWYSWVLSSLTGCVYTFGFIMVGVTCWVRRWLLCCF